MLDEAGLVAETHPAREVVTLTYSGLAAVEALLQCIDGSYGDLASLMAIGAANPGPLIPARESTGASAACRTVPEPAPPRAESRAG